MGLLSLPVVVSKSAFRNSARGVPFSSLSTVSSKVSAFTVLPCRSIIRAENSISGFARGVRVGGFCFSFSGRFFLFFALGGVSRATRERDPPHPPDSLIFDSFIDDSLWSQLIGGVVCQSSGWGAPPINLGGAAFLGVPL